MAYVPPARRDDLQQSSGGSSSDALHDHTYHLEKTFDDLKLNGSSKNPTALFADIHNHYWAPPQSNGTDDSSSPPSTLPIVLSHSTLNGSSLHRGKLQYVMLFKDANPRWISDGIIFVKSSLHLLPGYEQLKDAGAPSVSYAVSITSKEASTERSMAREEEASMSDAVDSQGRGEKQKVSTADDEMDAHKVELPEKQDKTKENLKQQKPGLVDVNLQRFPKSSLASNHLHDDPDNADATKPMVEEEITSTATPTSYSPDLCKNDAGPIAIFEQAGKRQDGHFRFAGYHKITNLQYLPPQSAELYRMLEQKFSTMDRFGRWTQKKRSAASWNASMSLMWAVIKMERDDEANARLGPPALTRSRAAEA